jgi:hypothetical protein
MTTCPHCGATIDDAPTTDRDGIGYPSADLNAPVHHLALVGAVPRTYQAGAGGGAEYQATCSCSWSGRCWPKRAEAQADGIAHLRETRR